MVGGAHRPAQCTLMFGKAHVQKKTGPGLCTGATCSNMATTPGPCPAHRSQAGGISTNQDCRIAGLLQLLGGYTRLCPAILHRLGSIQAQHALTRKKVQVLFSLGYLKQHQGNQSLPTPSWRSMHSLCKADVGKLGLQLPCQQDVGALHVEVREVMAA